MGTCEVCGNEYEGSFRVIFDSAPDDEHTFDSFECAIHGLAPICEHCGCKVVGHGMVANGRFFCCAHCGQHAGADELQDRA